MNIKDIITESKHACPNCGGPVVEYSELTEKKDACYYKVKASAKVWPSAYASGRLVQCRKKGAANYGNKSEGVSEAQLDEKCWDTHKQVGMKNKGGRQVPNCVPKESVTEGSLEEIDRRGFLKGVGAAAVAGAAGGAKADWEREEDFVDKLSGKKEIRFVNISPGNEYFLRFVSTDEAPVFYIGGLNFNRSINGKGRIKIDNGPVHSISFVPTDNKYPGTSTKIQPLDISITDLSKEIFSAKQKILIDVTEVTPGAPEERQRVATFIPKFLSKKESVQESVTEDLDAQFDVIEEMVESLAFEHGVDAEQIWEDFESVDDSELLETAAWRRKEGKSKKGGLNAKGVASYRRENPGSKLQTAVTTKPSKLKPGSKAAKRRKSFCARMGGVKGPMKKPNGKPTRKALALRKWNC